MAGNAVLDRVAREGFSEVVTFEQRHAWERLSRGRTFQAQGTATLKALRQKYA